MTRELAARGLAKKLQEDGSTRGVGWRVRSPVVGTHRWQAMMPKFDLDFRLPATFVTKELASHIESYLRGDMVQKFGDPFDGPFKFLISLQESIGTETLETIDEYAPTLFPDAINELEIRADSPHIRGANLSVRIDFDRKLLGSSRLTIGCEGPTARETALGIKEALLRIIKPHGTLNWVFNPGGFLLGLTWGLATSFSMIGLTQLTLDPEDSLSRWFLALGGFFWWVALSATFFRPHTSFDTSRQRRLHRVWSYLTLGAVGFVIFGTVFPAVRQRVLGF